MSLTLLDAETIAIELKNKPKLICINLAGVSIKDEGMVLISKALIDNHDLETIDLSATEIGAHQNGVDALCELLRHNPKLKSLYIKFNLFENDGIIAVHKALENCTMFENFRADRYVGEVVFSK